MALDTGTTAWLLIATALVMFMTPGVGLFYGGMVRRKNFISMIALSFIALALVSRAVDLHRVLARVRA